MPASLRRPPLTEAIRERLLGHYRRAEWLPPERSLAAELGVSRASLREAIKHLENQGLLESRHGIGVRVTDKPSTPLAQALRRVLPAPAERIRQFADVRILVEPEIARLAALRTTARTLSGLHNTQEALRCAPDLDAAVAADLDFHSRLADLAGNRVLALMLASMADVAAEARRVSLRQVGIVSAYAQHQRVLDAVATGDPDAALSAMRAHVHAAQSTPPPRRSQTSRP